MTTEEKVARRKLSLLDLAQELRNVSKACKVMGYSRQQFYEIRRNYQTYGSAGLLDKLPGARGLHRTAWRRRSSNRSWITACSGQRTAPFARPMNWRCGV